MLQETYKKILADFREVYNEAYYLSKDLNVWQRSWIKRKIWRSLKSQIRSASWRKK